MSESKMNPNSGLSPAERREQMMTVIVSEISMAPVASQYPMTVAIAEMAEYYGVDHTKEAVMRAMQADCNRQFRPTRAGTLMLADAAPDNWDGEMDSLPRPSWATDEDELERIAGRLPGKIRSIEAGEGDGPAALFE